MPADVFPCKCCSEGEAGWNVALAVNIDHLKKENGFDADHPDGRL